MYTRRKRIVQDAMDNQYEDENNVIGVDINIGIGLDSQRALIRASQGLWECSGGGIVVVE